MTISNDPSLIVHAYVDGELDAVQSLEIERQIAGDPTLAAERARVEALRSAIRERLPREAAPPNLVRRIEAAIASQHEGALACVVTPILARARSVGRAYGLPCERLDLVAAESRSHRDCR
jgi:anti-sigma factor RsiW